MDQQRIYHLLEQELEGAPVVPVGADGLRVLAGLTRGDVVELHIQGIVIVVGRRG